MPILLFLLWGTFWFFLSQFLLDKTTNDECMTVFLFCCWFEPLHNKKPSAHSRPLQKKMRKCIAKTWRETQRRGRGGRGSMRGRGRSLWLPRDKSLHREIGAQSEQGQKTRNFDVISSSSSSSSSCWSVSFITQTFRAEFRGRKNSWHQRGRHKRKSSTQRRDRQTEVSWHQTGR